MSLIVDIRKKLETFDMQVSFEAHDGVMGILGASGCGKSMTLKCIAGIVHPDSGRIVLDGVTLYDSEKHIDLKPQERHVGYLFQNYALFPNMTVQQNIMCGLKREKDRALREKLCKETVRAMQLDGLEKRYPAQLSGGQQQRVALARILVNRPKLLMLDEPFSALDTQLREKLLVEMKRTLKSYGGVSIAVTHSRDEAYKLCDTLALMDSGKLLAHMPTKKLFADPGSIAGAAMTGCKNIAAAEKTGEYEVFVPDWGIKLTTAKPVGDGLKAVGIRAHYYGEKASQNRYPVHITDLVEEPFEDIIAFRYDTQKEGTPDVWWRLTKEKRPAAKEIELGTAPANVLLLYE